MRRKNLGVTTLRKRRRTSDPMKEFDKMPKLLRDWLNTAALPWAPKSVHRAYHRIYQKNGDAKLALQHLEKLQEQRLSVDEKLI